ncbi:glycosyltransferase [Lactiplantibacillus plantarum]|uniref:glycosyltransferase n=1 Tax=Lactiplantibacillus plantarum TaxID=1590 RepID=UPI001BA7F926|nr:glycosyltransferase [Lactiplantibacillus plantarum]MBS0937697.1 glycosyltransferase [Lactiplantibacillus plantarum]MBS0945776.1 glycosyltransferase [Lactiplantibacillus plantarum]
MIYFINFGMPDKKSGIEHAELKRLKLFEAHEYPCKIITRDWYIDAHATAQRAGVDDDHLLNMFDYFQHTQHVEQNILKAQDIDLGLKNLLYSEEVDNNRYIVTRTSDRLVARINYDKKFAKQVTSVELFDNVGNLYRVDFYDSRGFKSQIQWYTPDNKIGTKEWLDINGRVKLKAFYRYGVSDKKNLIHTGWWLDDTEGKKYTFDTVDSLFEHFLNLVNSQGKNIFVLDRSLLADAALTRMKRKAFTVYHFHSSQVGDSSDPMNSMMNNHYEYGLVNINKYSAVISATQHQTDDIKKRFDPKVKMYTIPVGIVPEKVLSAPRVSMSKRTYGKVIAVARIASEKRLDDLVRAVKIVHDNIPEVTLDLYGYADSTNNFAEKKHVQKVADDLNISDLVTFKGYVNDVASVYDDAQIFGLTSTMEGFNLAIMEAISHGVLGLTYDVNYGPNNIIEDAVNGYIVENGNYEELAHKMINVLSNNDLLQKLSTGAYETSLRYSSDNIWKLWKQLIEDAQTELRG